jgi:hypothetical protein
MVLWQRTPGPYPKLKLEPCPHWWRRPRCYPVFQRHQKGETHSESSPQGAALLEDFPLADWRRNPWRPPRVEWRPKQAAFPETAKLVRSATEMGQVP